MAYTLFPDDDKVQGDGTSAITATSTKINGATVFGDTGSNLSNGPITAEVPLGSNRSVYGSQVMKRNAWSVYETDAVALTSVANNGSGKCRFTKAGHTLEVGDTIMVRGSTSGGVDGLHVVTAVPSSSTFDTNKTYVASASAGSYHMTDGRFADMTVNEYVVRGGVTSDVAGTGLAMPGFGSAGVRHAIHKLNHVRTLRTATAIRNGYYNSYTGRFTTAPTNADDISSFGTDDAANPTYAIPGELTYRISGQPSDIGVVQDDYPAVTQ